MYLFFPQKHYEIRLCRVTVKQTLYRPGQDRSVPGVGGSQSSRQTLQEDGKVVSPTHQEIFLVLVSVRA
jgi:hypothetical protein